MLTGILTYHVVSGKLSSEDLMKMAKEGGDASMLTTVAGGKLWVMKKGGKLWIKDEKGGTAQITIKDVNQSNGVIHVVNKVLLPK